MELGFAAGWAHASLSHRRSRGLYQIKLYHARQRSSEAALVSHTAAAARNFQAAAARLLESS
jgi:hypothetical protein